MGPLLILLDLDATEDQASKDEAKAHLEVLSEFDLFLNVLCMVSLDLERPLAADSVDGHSLAHQVNEHE